jgi:hypothetical protein
MDVEHALVIGGTGMLRRATVEIAERSRRLTAVARTAASLAILSSLLSARQGDRYETSDWNQPNQFVRDLQRLVNEVGPPTLVLAWLHDMNLGPRVAAAVSTPKTRCDFFQVIGSSGASPYGGAMAVRNQMETESHVKYFQVVLGFMQESGSSRWLTNDEISDGVLEAVRKRKAQHIIGTLDRWDQRPQ